MLRFAVRRLLLSVFTLIILIAIIFLLTRVFPSDPARQLAGPFGSQARVDELNEDLGLKDPLVTQFGRLLKDAVTLDFGESYSQPGERVIDLIKPRLANSAKLVTFALILTLPLSILGGVIAARKKDTLLDRTIVNVGLASSSIPEFVSGVFLQYILGVQLKRGIFGVKTDWFPAITTIPDGSGLLTTLRYLFLPALAIVFVYFGYIARIARAATIAALDADYTRTAYMKGLSSGEVIRKHVLRNSLQPAVAVTGTQIGYLFGGLIGLEVVFNYPGLGLLILKAATAPDFPLLQAGVITIAVIFMICTLAADLLIAWMNPRARINVGAS
jgi:peptide/nickel transport system permease protein